jgi:hypothetical protein
VQVANHVPRRPRQTAGKWRGSCDFMERAATAMEPENETATPPASYCLTMREQFSTVDLDAPRNLRHQSAEWFAERVGWMFIAGAILANAFGLLGPGLLSAREESSPDGTITVEYDALERYEAPAVMRLHFEGPSGSAGVIRVAISRGFIDRATPEHIAPAPLETQMQGDLLVYTFRAPPADARGVILFRYKYNSPGRLRFNIGIDGGPAIRVSQFVYP